MWSQENIEELKVLLKLHKSFSHFDHLFWQLWTTTHIGDIAHTRSVDIFHH